jgi:energy-coupling factor transport system ATP-binding protein
MDENNQNELAIEIENASFSYSSQSEPTIRNINLKVHRGEFIGMVGPTGSGKTTLLNLIAGVLPHYFPGKLDGVVKIFGKSTSEMNMAQLSIQIGLVMQDPDSQLFNLFVKDEIIWGLENLGVSREEIAKARDTSAKMFRIDKLLDRITYDLSGGEKQLTAITATYIMQPKILLFDNPTSALDPLGSQMVFEAINRLMQENPEMVVIVNDDKVEELAAFTKRMWLVDEGELKIDDEPVKFFSHREELAKAMIRTPSVTEVTYELSLLNKWDGSLALTTEQFMSTWSQKQ